MQTEIAIGAFINANQACSLYQVGNELKAQIGEMIIESLQIKYGISQNIPHDNFLQKIKKVANEKIKDIFTVFAYLSPNGGVEKIWILEATKRAATIIKNAQEKIEKIDTKNDQEKIELYQQALKLFRKALELQVKTNGETEEIKSFTKGIEKEVFLLDKIKNQLAEFLPQKEDRDDFHLFFDPICKIPDDIFPELKLIGGLKEIHEREPYEHLMSAWAYEGLGKPIQAAENYLRLARISSLECSLLCLKHAVKLVKGRDALDYANFLENIDRPWLKKLVKNVPNDKEAKKVLLEKDAFRMVFEKSLATIDFEASKKNEKKPSTFICFTFEKGIHEWIESTILPDLKKIGMEPIICFEKLVLGMDLNQFQAQIRKTDQVILICTPQLKETCDKRNETKAITGVAMEIRLMIERFNDPEKHGKIFPIYLKGERKFACPSVFIEPVLGSNISQDDTLQYYSGVFELFGAMRGIERGDIRNKIKPDFLEQIKDMLQKDNYNEQLVEDWREKYEKEHAL